MKSLNKNPETPPKLKRFLAFAGDDYYPKGGLNDFFGDFSSLDEAKDALIQNEKKEWENHGEKWLFSSSWAQIFDTETQKIVWTEQNN